MRSFFTSALWLESVVITLYIQRILKFYIVYPFNCSNIQAIFFLIKGADNIIINTTEYEGSLVLIFMHRSAYDSDTLYYIQDDLTRTNATQNSIILDIISTWIHYGKSTSNTEKWIRENL